MARQLCIACTKDDLDQGLFGNVFYYVFQVLPYLHENRIFPAWQIRTKHYGDPPEYLTIPGALDLAYPAPEPPYDVIALSEMRRRHAHILGNDWQTLHELWSSYFSIPERITRRSDDFPLSSATLGIHYRGTDKQSATWDSNPITQSEFISLVVEFLEHRPEFDNIVAATDEYSLISSLSAAVQIPVVGLGEVEFHMAGDRKTPGMEKCDRAVLDCLLLSKCRCLIESSSALPSFAKVLNPSLEIYRTAASKLFSDMPYFPVAYIPVLPVESSSNRDILSRTMEHDWVSDPRAPKFQKSYTFMPRYPRNHKLFSFSDRFGSRFSDAVACIASGYK